VPHAPGRRIARRLALAFALAGAGCGGEAAPVDAGAPDLAALTDGGAGDGGPTIDQIARACAIAVACGPSSGMSVAACVDGQLARIAWDPVAWTPFDAAALQGHARLVPCAAGVASCAEYIDCLTLGHGATWFQTHPPNACDGDVAVNLLRPGLLPSVEDCAAEGMRCRLMNGKYAVCSDGNSCPSNSLPCLSTTTWCYSTVEGTCPNGGVCLQQGAAPVCVPAGDECGGPLDLTCSGTDVSYCQRYREVVHCGRIGGHCIPDGGAACVPDAMECQTSAPDACRGASLSVCVNGRTTTLDCAALGVGFTTCIPAADGGTLGARCAP
jgi:hypothetical protein